MKEKLKEQDDKLIYKIAKLTQMIQSLKLVLESQGGNSVRIGAATRTQPPSPPPPENNTAYSHSDTDFTPVRRGAKPVRQVIQPTICSNRFQIFEEEDEPANSFLVGDSTTRQQLTEFCGRVRHRRRLFCLLGAELMESQMCLTRCPRKPLMSHSL